MSAKRKKPKPIVHVTAASDPRASEGHTAKPILQPGEGTLPTPASAEDTFRYRDYDGSERVWHFVRWKNRDEHQVCDEFFARDEHGRQVVLKPLLPLLPDGRWTAPPFPESNPYLIEPFRLIPPPCRATLEEASALRHFITSSESRGCADFPEKRARYIRFARERFGVVGSVIVPELWELIYAEALAPKPEDDRPLQGRLDAALSGWREEHESRSQAIDALTETEVQLHIYGENATERVSKEQAAKYIEDERTALRFKFTEPKARNGIGGCLHTTLADVKAGNIGGIRNNYLHQQWAAEHGFDLPAMAREKIEFLQWLKRRYVNRKVNVINIGVSGLDFHLVPAQELAVLASVRYVLHLSTGERIYIAGLDVREKLREEECRQLVRTDQQDGQGVPTVAIGSGSPKGPCSIRHSANFRELFWEEDAKRVEALLTKNQATAVSALWHAEGHILSREEWQQAIYGDSPPADFRPDKLFAYKDGLKVWRSLIRVEGCRYRLIGCE